MSDTTRTVRPRFVPPPYQDSAESGRLILRDGSTASVRLATPADEEALAQMFARLSEESRRRRFFSVSPPGPSLVASLCDNTDPRRTLTLVVTRTTADGRSIVATGSYLAKDEHTAE